MPIFFECEKCKSKFDGFDETYCSYCYVDLEIQIRDLIETRDRLKDRIQELMEG